MNQEMISYLLIVISMVAATVITRFLPFIMFPAGKETPPYIAYLGKTLPYATIGLLVVYCLKGVSFQSYPYGLSEALSVVLIVILHHVKGNSLLSIGAGTAFYMILTQLIFR